MSTYEVNGIQYPSVTTILGQLDKSNALIPWALNCMEQKALELIKDKSTVSFSDILLQAKKEYREVSKQALDIGSQVHDTIEQYIKNGKDAIGKMLPEVENAMIALFDWESANIDKWIESEKKVYHDKICYAGTLDAVAQMKDGSIAIIDFKTSKGFYSGYAEQLSAYRCARQNISDLGIDEVVFKHKTDNEEMAEFKVSYEPVKINAMGILRLDKETGLPEYKDFSKNYDNAINAFTGLVQFYYYTAKRRLKNNPRVI